MLTSNQHILLRTYVLTVVVGFCCEVYGVPGPVFGTVDGYKGTWVTVCPQPAHNLLGELSYAHEEVNHLLKSIVDAR